MIDDPIIKNVVLAAKDLREGRMVVMLDDEDRENEGDLVFAAEFADKNRINFMVTQGRGLVCLALKHTICDKLGLPLIQDPNRNRPQKNTAFTVSIEAAKGITTGIAPAERALTIKAAINPNAKQNDLVVPGHVFPLRAVPGGVLERPGHTEASVALAEMAGLTEAAVICEIIDDSGDMSRRPQLELFCEKFGLRMITVAEIVYAKKSGFLDTNNFLKISAKRSSDLSSSTINQF